MKRLSLASTLFTTLLASASSHSARAASRKTEAQKAKVIGDAECQSYSYAPANAIASMYPLIWATANVSQSGLPSYDRKLFATMNSSIPDIAPRGTRDGNFKNVTYDASDPDCWWSWNKCTSPKLAGLQDDVTKCDEPDSWGFTLDDGPNCSHNAYYDYLLSIDQKATLFYIGSNVMDWPSEAQRGLADGHEICSHTWSHPYMTSLTNEQAFAELYYSKKIIKALIGVTVQCWRPPYGDVDDRIRWIAQSLGMQTVIWSDDTDDFDVDTLGASTVVANYNKILKAEAAGNYTTEGTIVLMHELDNATMALGEQFLPNIEKAFTGGVMPVAVCMNNTQPYVEQGGKYVYPNAAQWLAGTHTISLAAPSAVTANFKLQMTASASGSAVGTSTKTSGPKSQMTSLTSTAGASTSSTSTSAAGGRRTGLGWMPLGGVALAMSLGIVAVLGPASS